MRKITALCALLAAIVVACDRGGSVAESPSPDESRPAFDQGTVVIETDDQPVIFRVEVAQTPEQRAYGLMNREQLDDDAGMVFLFFEEHRGGFWMKDTLIPLSIAFFDVDGEILRILDMVPCEEEPCKVYDPGVTYSGALEVNRGAFEREGVEEGDIIRLTG